MTITSSLRGFFTFLGDLAYCVPRKVAFVCNVSLLTTVCTTQFQEKRFVRSYYFHINFAAVVVVGCILYTIALHYKLHISFASFLSRALIVQCQCAFPPKN